MSIVLLIIIIAFLLCVSYFIGLKIGYAKGYDDGINIRNPYGIRRQR